ncbi:MAG: GIY-YIG nuclease family protein [Candidatus Aenigmarchaeota archaeon]|nr:GIY-YIG nuclease family protein [Candidatus Aenigmarchaeota archaeon]
MKGVYVLLIKVSRNVKLKVGCLGVIKFSKGFYAYVGSAQNSLESRIKRHFRKRKKKFWHIDYLLSNSFSSIQKVFYLTSDKDMECRIATIMIQDFNYVPGFGSSDCKCASHLVKVSNIQNFYEIIRELNMKEFNV